jgi:hypothetical protein
VVGGLLGWKVERAVDDPQLHPARLTVDPPRPTAPEPLEVRTTVHHDRRRLRLVEAVLVQAGAPVARASALFLRRGPQPDGEVCSPSVRMPPLPEGSHPTPLMRTYGWGSAIQNPDPAWDQTAGPKHTWLAHSSNDGVVAGSAVLVDHMGPIGTGVAVAIAQSGFRPPSDSALG